MARYDLQGLPVRARDDLVRAITCGIGGVTDLKKRNCRRINFLDRCRKPGQAKRGRKIICHSRFSSDSYWKSEMKVVFSIKPDSFLFAIFLGKELESRYIRQMRRRRELTDIFFFQSAREIVVGNDQFAQANAGLLPFAVQAYVRVVAAAKTKDIKRMTVFQIVGFEPMP